jgi:HSP20 family molecular chaperone IbpA
MSLFTTLIPSLTRTPAHRRGAATTPDIGPAIKPAYEIKETDDAFGVTVQLPGVTKDGLELTAEQDQLRIVGRRTWKQPAGWTALYRESTEVPFELVLEHDNAVDLDKIQAELADGVLRVALPKAAAIKPRKIAVS